MTFTRCWVQFFKPHKFKGLVRPINNAVNLYPMSTTHQKNIKHYLVTQPKKTSLPTFQISKFEKFQNGQNQLYPNSPQNSIFKIWKCSQSRNRRFKRTLFAKPLYICTTSYFTRLHSNPLDLIFSSKVKEKKRRSPRRLCIRLWQTLVPLFY